MVLTAQTWRKGNLRPVVHSKKTQLEVWAVQSTLLSPAQWLHVHSSFGQVDCQSSNEGCGRVQRCVTCHCDLQNLTSKPPGLSQSWILC